jgi:di/tricarboxylate transporter
VARTVTVALFVGAGNSTSLMATLVGTSVNAEVYAFGRSTIRSLFSVYAMRMAAVFWVLLLSLVILFDRPLSHDSRPEPGELSTHQPS